MVLRQFTKEEFIQYLNAFGFKLEADIVADQFPQFPMLGLARGSESIILLNKESYIFNEVCSICEDYNIPIPDDFVAPWEQIQAYPNL